MINEQTPLTAEEIFKKSLAYQHISESFYKYVHDAMQQYADQETAQLRQELEQEKVARKNNGIRRRVDIEELEQVKARLAEYEKYKNDDPDKPLVWFEQQIYQMASIATENDMTQFQTDMNRINWVPREEVIKMATVIVLELEQRRAQRDELQRQIDWIMQERPWC